MFDKAQASMAVTYSDLTAITYPDGLGAAQSRELNPHVRSIPRRWTAILMIGDLAMFLLAALVATVLVQAHWKADVNVDHVKISTAIYAVIWIAIFWRLGLYSRSFAFTVRDEFYYTIAALCIGIAPQLVAFSVVPSISTSRATLLVALVLSIVSVGSFRVVAHKAHEYVTRDGRRVVVVGAPERLDGVVEQLCRSGNFLVYWLAVRDLDQSLSSPAAGTTSGIVGLDWFRAALQYRADQILFTEVPPPDAMPQLLLAAAQNDVSIAIAPPRIRAHAYNVTVDKAGSQVLLVPEQLRVCRPAARLFKRLFDLAAALVVLILASPVMAAIWAMLALDRSGPVFYKQVRVGRNGRPFEILKFRTMRVDAEKNGAVFAVQGDPRVTPIGRLLRRTSLDELPQLFNVIRGDMSVVGPRPERPVFVEQFRGRYPRYDERHLVKPGITGCAQVNMRRVMASDDVGEKIKHDLFYIENWSPSMDLSVVTKTAMEFLFHRAA